MCVRIAKKLKQLITVEFNVSGSVNYMVSQCPSITSFIAVEIFPVRGTDKEK